MNAHVTNTDVAPVPVEAPRKHNALNSVPDGYEMLSDGIYYQPPHDGDDGEEMEPVYVCSPLRVDALFRDTSGKGWGILTSVVTRDGQWHEVPLSEAEMFNNSKKAISVLVNHGLRLGLDKKAKDLLAKLLLSWKPERRLLTVERPGWVDDNYNTFLVGSNIIGTQEVLPPAIPSVIRSGLATRGSVEDWKQNVAMKCQGNPLMILAVSLAFSGPLLAPLGMHGGGLHFRGSSSSGKTTLLKLAASVWGGHGLISPWRATTNGLEGIAGSMNDMLLPLDEIAEISPRDLPQAIYMLANGTGKARMTKDAILDEQARWRLALISSGEISIAEKLSEGGRQAMDGHEVRLIDIEADSRAHGAFDDLHGAASGAVFADEVQRAVAEYHGSAGPAFVGRLLAVGMEKILRTTRNMVKAHASDWTAMLPVSADGQTSRVAERFATIGIAGHLVTKCGFTGWHEGDASIAARQAFLDWHDWRYSAQQDAVNAVVEPLQKFLAANLDTLPDVNDPHVDGDDPSGWRDATRVYLQKNTWASIYPGDEGKKAASALRDMKMLVPGEGNHLQHKAPRSIRGLHNRIFMLNTEQVLAYKAA